MAQFYQRSLHDAALRCCENEESKDAEQMCCKFLDILESPLHDVALKLSAREDWLAHCEEMLQQAMNLLKSSTSCSLVLCEKLGLELPRVVVKYVGLSQACQNLCLNIIEALVEVCSPREMFTAFMEALNMYTTCQTLLYCIPLLKGLALVFSRLQRRQMQFFMEASPGLLLVVRLAMQDGEVNLKWEETFEEFVPKVHGNMAICGEELQAAIMNEVVQVAHTVKVTCDALQLKVRQVAEEREDLQLKLGRFALELLASTGGRIAHPAEIRITAAVVELVELLPLCGLSVLWLLTGDHIDSLIESTAIEPAQDNAELYISKLEATKGVALAVYWALNNPRVAAAVQVSIDILQKQIEFFGRKGVINALCVASSLLSTWSPTGLSTGMALVQLIVEISCPMITSSDGDDWLALTMKIMPFLESLQGVIVQAPDMDIRRQAFIVIKKLVIVMYLVVDGEQPSEPRPKKVIQEVLPNATKFNSLQVLINNSHFPALVSLLLICIKDEVARAWPTSSQHQGILSSNGDSAEVGHQVQAVVSPFVSEEALRVVGTVLRPTAGLPPDLVTHVDPIQSALNLYRFILIRESSGRTNYTGIISKKTLTRALTQWLLPLSELVGNVSSGSIVEEDGLYGDIHLAMDRLGSVLKRCVELTQAALTFSE